MNSPPPFTADQYKSVGAMAKILPGIACNLTDRLTVGGTFGLGINYAELDGPYYLQAPGPFRGTPMILGLHTWGAAPVFSVGAQYDVSEQTTVGVTYQSESRYKLDGHSQVNVPGLGPTKYDTDVNVVWPQSLGFGVKHQMTPCRLLAMDIIWFNWSDAFDSFNLQFRNSSNPAYNAAVGPVLHEQFPLNWRDSVSVRLGHELRLDEDKTLRVGYTYHANPIPNSTLTPFIQATLEHAFTAGYGWKFNDKYYLDLAYQFSFGRDRTVQSSSFVNSNFDNSFSHSTVHWLFASVMQRF